MKKIIVAGSSGLIGSGVCTYFAPKGQEIHGADNNQRAVFGASQSHTRPNHLRLRPYIQNIVHHQAYIPDSKTIIKRIPAVAPAAIIRITARPAKYRDKFIPGLRITGAYNVGCGKQNTCSILEEFDIISIISGKAMQ